MYRPMLIVALVALCAGSAACGGSDSSSAVTPVTVAEYVALKEATDTMTRTLLSIQAADATTAQLAGGKGSPAQLKSLAQGVELSWNNVEVVMNGFTGAQGLVVPGLVKTVGAYKGLAISWQHGAEVLVKNGGRPPKGTTVQSLLAPLQRREEIMRPSLTKLGATIASRTCSIQKAHDQLAVTSAVAQSCAAARQLQQQAGAG
jgi:hypothetical protein